MLMRHDLVVAPMTEDGDKPDGPLGVYNRWSVEVLRGAEFDLDADVPAEFGVPNVTVGGDGPDDFSEPSVNLVYSPVGLGIGGNAAWLYVNHPKGGNKNFRFMYALEDLRLDWDGELLLSGMEERKDGALVRAMWRAERFDPTIAELQEADRIAREYGIDPDAP
jgi:hypothetical protein